MAKDYRRGFNKRKLIEAMTQASFQMRRREYGLMCVGLFLCVSLLLVPRSLYATEKRDWEAGRSVPTERTVAAVSSRASATQVGSIMALLATFEEARVLPPEGSPEADQLIHALIQFQSVFMKSSDPAVRKYFTGAMRSYFFDQADEREQLFLSRGWTSEILEAVLLYEAYPQSWKGSALDSAFASYNVDRKDFYELREVFNLARRNLLQKRQDIHVVYRVHRKLMPGAYP